MNKSLLKLFKNSKEKQIFFKFFQIFKGWISKIILQEKISNFQEKISNKKIFIKNFQNFNRKISKIKIFQIFRTYLQMKNLHNKWRTMISFHIPQWFQHQVSYPYSTFIKACKMFQTRGIGQVCPIIFNE